MEALITTANPGPETPEPRDAESIQTADERRRRYREGLKSSQAGRGIRLKQFLLEMRRYFRGLDREARRLHLQEIDLMFRYFRGDQYGYYDERGGYKDSKQEGDFAYVISLLTGHVGQAFVQFIKTTPQYKVFPEDRDDPSGRRLARMCEELGTGDLKRMLNESMRQREALHALLAGDSFREVFWSPHPKSPRTVRRPKFKTVVEAIPGRRECQACKSGVSAGEEACASCGATFVVDIPPGEARRQEPDGYEEVPLGENCMRIPHPMGIQRDLSAQEFEHSTYLIERDFIDRHVGEWDAQSQVERGDSPLSEEMRTRYELERSGTQMSSTVGAARAPGLAPHRKVERERHFWSPGQYGWFYCEVEETLPDGSKIPAGTFLGDHFPDGLHVRFDGDTVMTVKPVRMTRRWTQVQYGKQPGSAVGGGTKIAMPLQDAVNDNFNLGQTIKTTSARPLTVVAGQSVKLLPEAGQFLRIDKLPPGVSDVRAAIAQYPGQSAAGLAEDSETIHAAMQFILRTSTLGGGGAAGAPDMRAASTATGVVAMQEQTADGQRGPVGLLVHADKETIYQCLENRRDHSSPEQRAELAKRYGADTARAFFGCNFRQELVIEVAPNTDVPTSMALTVAMQEAFAQVCQGLLPVIDKVPWVSELLSAIADSMGVPFDVAPGRADRREAELRLNMLAAIEEQALEEEPALATNSLALAQTIYGLLAKFRAPLVAEAADQREDVPRVFLQDHDTFLDVYKDAVFSEKAQSWSQARKLVVLRLWEDHFKAKLGQQFELAELQKELQEALAPGPNPEALAAAQEGERTRALEEEALRRQADEQSAQAEHRRKLELEDKKSENTLTLEAMRQDGQQQQGADAR